MNRYVVLDTNCLLQSLSRRNKYHNVWESFLLEKYVLCVSNEILEEYEEIIASHMSPIAARIAIETIVANADYIVTEDSHFNVLKTIPFPKIEIIRLQDFSRELLNKDN